MYTITRKTYLHSQNVSPKSTLILRVNCSKEELSKIVIPIKGLIDIENSHHKLIGSDKRCIAVIEEIKCNDIDKAIELINKNISVTIVHYNQKVDDINVRVRRANKVYCKPSDDGIISHIDNKVISNIFDKIEVEYSDDAVIIR